MPVDTITQENRKESGDTVSLRDYTDQLFNTLKLVLTGEIKRMEDVHEHIRISASTEQGSIHRQFQDEKDAIKRQFDAIHESTKIAAAAMDSRLQGMNEFRSSMGDMASRFVQRTEVDSAVRSVTDRVTKLESHIVSREEHAQAQTQISERIAAVEKFSSSDAGRQGGNQQVIAYAIAIFMALAAMVTIVISLFHH